MTDMKSRSSRHKVMMHLLRCIAFIEASLECVLAPVYNDTESNHQTDDLSRNNVKGSVRARPRHANLPLPPGATADQEVDWTAQVWWQQFRRTIPASSTHQTYKSGPKHFIEFFTFYNIINQFPVTESSLLFCSVFS